MDAGGCSRSGSLKVIDRTNIVNGWSDNVHSECITVSDSTTYNIGGWGYMPTQSPQPIDGLFQILWYNDSNCTQWRTDGYFYTQYLDTPRDTWQYLYEDGIQPPPGAKAMRWMVAVSRAKTGAGKPQVFYVDSIFFTPAPGRF
jgi:hypothetical protein